MTMINYNGKQINVNTEKIENIRFQLRDIINDSKLTNLETLVAIGFYLKDFMLHENATYEEVINIFKPLMEK